MKDDGKIKVINEAWLNLDDINDELIFNPMKFIGSANDSHYRLLWLMTRPEYFSFLCKHILNVNILPSQALFLHEMWNRKFPMLIASRGFGKSFILSLYSILRALILPERKIVIVGAAFRQSKVLFEYMETIWNKAPILRSMCDAESGPRRDVDRCVLRINHSRVTCLPLGDGQKIRGQRANDIISDEFASIPRDIFENVVAGFAAVSSDPIENVKNMAAKKKAKEYNLDYFEEDSNILKKSDNQIILSGTAYYDFNHFAQYWKKWKSIIKSQGKESRLRDIFNEDPPEGFNWKDYSIIRIPYELLPEGFMDSSQVARSKATVHAGIYQMEFGACLEPSTLIQTDTGLREIQDVLIGDKVLTHKGRFRSVTRVMRRHYEGPIVKVSSYGLTGNTRITPEHPIWVGGDEFLSVDQNFDNFNLANLSELSGLKEVETAMFCNEYLETSCGNYIYPKTSQSRVTVEEQSEIRSSAETQGVLCERYKISQSAISYIKNDKRVPKGSIPSVIKLSYDFGLILGYYLSEGSVSVTGNSTEFALDEHKDTKFKEQLVNAVANVFALEAKIYIGKKNVYRVCVNSRLFSNTMRHLCGSYSDKKLVLHDVMFSNEDMLKGIIAGYWNGDGHIGTKHADAHCVNQSMLSQIKLGLSYFGISSSLMHSGGNHNLKLSGDNFRSFLSTFYGDSSQATTGSQKILNDGSKSIFPVKSRCSEPYSGDVFNLHVDEDESYSLINATVHNCFTRDSQGFFKRSLIEACVTNDQYLDKAPIKDKNGIDICFSTRIRGDIQKKYIFGVDPASEVDNFSIVILELNEDHRRVVHCWTTNRDQHKEKIKSGFSSESDFYAYCARKIRDLMIVFPCVQIAMDAGGGGIAVMESLHDKDKIQENEVPIWETIDPEKPKDSDDNRGLHILEMCQFSRYDWVSESNHGMRKDFEDKALLFPMFDTLSLDISAIEDEMKGRSFDTLEQCVMEIEDLKDELAMIQISQTPSGRDKWDTPETVIGTGKKGKLRKDRYSALLMANMSARTIARTPSSEIYNFYGGFATIEKEKDPKGKLYNGPAWFTDNMNNNLY